MSGELTIRRLITDYKIDTPTDRNLFAFDTFLKIASLFMLTAALWALIIQGSRPPSHPLYVPIFLCIAAIVLTFLWIFRNMWRAGRLMWNYEDLMITDLEVQFHFDHAVGQRISGRFEIGSVRACRIMLESGIKRFDKDVALLSPLGAASGAITLVSALLASSIHPDPWIAAIGPAFMFGVGSGAILKIQLAKRMVRYEFIVANALRLADGS
jgi:hypothetical protein